MVPHGGVWSPMVLHGTVPCGSLDRIYVTSYVGFLPGFPTNSIPTGCGTVAGGDFLLHMVHVVVYVMLRNFYEGGSYAH